VHSFLPQFSFTLFLCNGEKHCPVLFSLNFPLTLFFCNGEKYCPVLFSLNFPSHYSSAAERGIAQCISPSIFLSHYSSATERSTAQCFLPLPWERGGVRAPDRTVKIRNPISFQSNSPPDPLHSSLSFCEKYHSLPCICTINGRCLAEFV